MAALRAAEIIPDRLYQGIVVNPDRQGGQPTFSGRRIPVATIAGMVAAGDAPRVHQRLWDSPFHEGRRAMDAVIAARTPASGRYTPKRVAAGALRRALRLVER